MEMKRATSLVLVSAMTAGLLAGCGSGGGDVSNTAESTASATSEAAAQDTTESAATTDTQAAAAEKPEVSHDEEMTFEIYDAAANYQGEQTGWFAKVLKDNLNIKVNIVAPQVAGDAVYQTRASSGNLGDIVILDGTQFNDCLSAGLVKDISADIYKYPNLAAYQEQIDVFNESLDGIQKGQIYGIPCQMTDTSPLTYSQALVYSAPLLRWDRYKEIGEPDIKDLDGLLDALEAIHKAHPKNDKGDPEYPLSLWADWDGGDGMIGIANVVQLTTWYGEKIKGSAILKSDNTFTSLTDKNATYYKMLQFLNHAYQRGLVDPDSGTQDWNSVMTKISNGQIDLMWYNWQRGFWNSLDRLHNGTAYTFIPVDDQNYYTDSDTYFGSGRVFGIGSQVDDEKYQRILDFLDWYASPDGLRFQHDGIKDFTYTVGSDGKLTAINDNALMDNLPVPEEYGGGGYNDGNNQINQWICDAICTDPTTGESYNRDYWSSYLEDQNKGTMEEWSKKFDATDATDWMKKNGKLLVSPNVPYTVKSDDADMSVIRNQVNQSVCDYSWKMVFAKSDKEFDQMWDAMTEELNGFGFETLYQFDCDNYQGQVDAKIEAAKEAQ